MVSPVRADLGLAGKAPKEVGAAVKNAVAAIYAGTTDPAAIQSQIVAILDEAAATGDEDAIRYAIVAVMLAGGTDNLDLSKQAIANSAVFTTYQKLAEDTTKEAGALMTGEEQGGEKPGGGDNNPFDLPPPGDGDVPATGI